MTTRPGHRRAGTAHRSWPGAGGDHRPGWRVHRRWQLAAPRASGPVERWRSMARAAAVDDLGDAGGDFERFEATGSDRDHGEQSGDGSPGGDTLKAIEPPRASDTATTVRRWLRGHRGPPGHRRVHRRWPPRAAAVEFTATGPGDLGDQGGESIGRVRPIPWRRRYRRVHRRARLATASRVSGGDDQDERPGRLRGHRGRASSVDFEATGERNGDHRRWPGRQARDSLASAPEPGQTLEMLRERSPRAA